MTARITFCGGAGSVTGANFLLDTGSKKILIDCGTQEIEHVCDTVNTQPFPYDVKTIDALVITHAHQDHIGRVPRLVRAGYTGPIYSTAATKDLSAVMFDDALSVMYRHAQEHGCEILYEKEHIDAALSQWEGKEYHAPFSIGDVSIELLDAGHILGSSLVKFSRNDRSIIFTGDLGNTPEPLLRDTESPVGANYLVMESVYGDRVHEGREERVEALRLAVEDARQKQGVLLIPSFSLERTQVLLFELNNLIESKKMEPLPVYLDAPLAIRITDVFRKYPQLFNQDARGRIAGGDDLFAFSGLHVVPHTGDSRAIHKEKPPFIIIAGAGMSGGGRVRAHEIEYLPKESTTLLFVGYQAPRTLGRQLLEGATKVTIDGETVPVHASIQQLSGYSGHADRDQLIAFVEKAGEHLKKVFVTMGEPKSSAFLAQRLHDFLGVDAIVPDAGSTQEIEL